jgi:flagellar biosynthesis regulator FlaF
MYEFSYSSIFEEPPARVPSRSRLISNAIELFDAAGRPSFQPFEQRQLLSDFRSLWLLIADDVFAAQQSGFAAAMQNVLQEIERRRFAAPRSAAQPEMRLEPLS